MEMDETRRRELERERQERLRQRIERRGEASDEPRKLDTPPPIPFAPVDYEALDARTAKIVEAALAQERANHLDLARATNEVVDAISTMLDKIRADIRALEAAVQEQHERGRRRFDDLLPRHLSAH
jgi:hypothetical protein